MLILFNTLIIFILAQIAANFSLFGAPLIIVLIIFGFVGILFGIYLSFKSDENISPDFQVTNLQLPKSQLKFLNYSLYTELSNILNNQTKKLEKEIRKKKLVQNNDTRLPLAKQLSNLFYLNEENLNAEYSLISKTSTGSENGSLSISENDLMLDDCSRTDLFKGGDLIIESQFNSKIDTYIEEIIELVIRDFVMSWLSDFIWDKDKFFLVAKAEFKYLIEILRKRIRNLDFVKLISKDIITIFSEHYFNVSRCSNSNEKFYLQVYEISPEKEQEHLRNIIELILLKTFDDKYYLKNSSTRALIRELFVNKIFYPIIEMMSESDYLNQRLIDFISSKENQKNISRTFSFESYEDFIKTIKTSNAEELSEIRYKIMNELMQATIIKDFIQNTNDSSVSNSNYNPGIINCGTSSFYASFSNKTNQTLPNTISKSNSINQEKNNKGDMLKSRDLKKYIKQLRYAKNLCQKRLNSNANILLEDDEAFENKIKNKKILPFETVLKSKIGLISFLKYLEHDGSDALLRYWIDVQKLKKIPSKNLELKYELANRIYENYLKSYDSPVRDEIGKDLYKSMQLFLIGNETDECFIKAQEKIKNTLESDHYLSFLVTDNYEKLVENFETRELTDEEVFTHYMDSELNQPARMESDSLLNITKENLEKLKEKLNIKLSAMANTPNDSRRKEFLENEITNLKREISLYEKHIEKTEIWCDNIGKWTTNVLKATLVPNENSNENVLHFEILVKLTDSDNSEIKTEGWPIYKTFKEFEQLNENIRDLISINLKNKFSKIQENYKKSFNAKKAEDKITLMVIRLDEYLQEISKDPDITQSNALYSFLCPSHELGQNSRKSGSNEDKFSITSIFKGSKSKETQLDEYLDDIFADPDLKLIDSDSNDSIAEHFYSLIEEVFELKGMKKLFRKSLVMLVQLTFGGTINRKIRESVYWLISDEQVSYYLKQLKDSFWMINEVDGSISLIPYETTNNSSENKVRSKKISRHKLRSNIPEILQRLFGEKNSQTGVMKLFELFQNKKLNKHLLYEIIELLTEELIKDSI